MSLPADFDPFDGPPSLQHAVADGRIDPQGKKMLAVTWPQQARGDIAALIQQALHADDERRLLRLEAAIAGSTQMEREALCEWLGAMLHRPPLERPTPAYRPMRAVIEALWWDLHDRTPDPLEPDAPSPAILPNHPWGEGSEG